MSKKNIFHYLIIPSFLFVISCEDNEPKSGDLSINESEPVTLFINEFLASNDTCCSDEEGEFDDWVELYNSSSNPIDVGGMYVADNLDDDLYLIPNTNSSQTTVPANGYLILWFDKDEDQGAHHIGEKLSADGEGIYLLSDSTTFIDSLSFGIQETDVSMGRSPDGSDNWVKFTSPTPGAKNN